MGSSFTGNTIVLDLEKSYSYVFQKGGGSGVLILIQRGDFENWKLIVSHSCGFLSWFT